MILNYLNIFIEKFLENNNLHYLISLWRSEHTQEALLKHCKKYQIKLKDPCKPKRGKSAFLYFCDEKRDQIRNLNPDLSVKEIVSKLGSMWQEEKSKGKINEYEQMSMNDRNRYKMQMKTYHPTKLKKENVAFNKFVSLKYDKILLKYPNFNSKQIRRHLKDKWNKMPLEKKEKYV